MSTSPESQGQLQAIETDQAPAPVGPYNQAVRAGQLLFCSGQIALDPATGAMVGNGVDHEKNGGARGRNGSSHNGKHAAVSAGKTSHS